MNHTPGHGLPPPPGNHIIVRGRATRAALIQALATAVIFGTIPAIVKATEANPWTLVVFRLAVATCGIWFVARNRRAIFAHRIGDLARMSLLGVLLAVHWATYLFSIKLSSASIASLALSSFGVFLTFLGAWFGRHRITWADFLPMLVALAGALMVVPDPRLDLQATFGFVLAVVSAFCFACLPLLHQRLRGLSPSHRIPIQYTVAMLVLLPALPATRWDLRPVDWLIIVYLGIVGTLVAHTLWAHATTTLPTITTSLIYYLHIPFALSFGAIFLRERLAPTALAGGAIIVVASLWGVIRQQRSRFEPAPGQGET